MNPADQSSFLQRARRGTPSVPRLVRLYRKGPRRTCPPGPFAGFRGKLQVLLVGLDHLLDHLAADRAGLAGGQVAVVAVLQIHADLPWCTPNILKCSFSHVFAIRKGGMVPSTSQCGTGSTLLCREDTIGVTCGSTGQLWQETLELEGPPAHR